MSTAMRLIVERVSKVAPQPQTTTHFSYLGWMPDRMSGRSSWVFVQNWGEEPSRRAVRRQGIGMTPIDAIQSDLARFLEGLGFRSRERAFNRPTDDGLTQVVEIELARVDASRRRPIPGLDESQTGSFSVSLGVLVPEIFRRDFDRERPEFSYAKDCAIRLDLGALGPEKRELWWLVALHDEVSKEVVQRLDRDGLPFLERLESREAIVARWRDDPSLRRDARAPYVVAGIL